MDNDDDEIGDGLGISDILSDAGVMKMDKVLMNEELKDHVVDVAVVKSE